MLSLVMSFDNNKQLYTVKKHDFILPCNKHTTHTENEVQEVTKRQNENKQ